MKKLLASLMFLAVGAVHAGTAELVKNGSFENNGIANGSWVTTFALDNWTVGPMGTEVRNNVSGAAQAGDNYLELDTWGNGWISQAFDTVTGTQYNLSFFYAARENTAAATNGIDVLWNGKLLKHVAADNFTSQTNWSRIDLSVFAVGSLSTLQFSASGNSDGYGGSLDNVSLKAAVPEPGTLASIMLGLGLLGFTLRRRRQ